MNVKHFIEEKMLIFEITEEMDHHVVEKIRKRTDYEIQRLIPKEVIFDFTKVKFNDRLDKRYFLFLFNSYNDVQRQKERELQGNGVIQRIPLKALGQMVIPVVPMEEQIKIGAIYAEASKLQSNINRYAELVVRYTNMILENQLKEGRTHE